ncbi:MAG TPA: hypothetical protein VFE33_00125 [Thermoanaerobaculia bacterium]|nr:hypothetical protein [Thermoanaerobaculia bacterium]
MTDLSVAQILADLAAQIARVESQEAFHAQQEVLHREQRAQSAADLLKLQERYEAFKAAAVAAEEVVTRAPVADPVRQEDEDARVQITTVSKLVARVAEARTGTFGPTAVAQEINQRFGRRLGRPLDTRTVSVTLRRLSAMKRIHLVREGKAFHEALYAPGPRPKPRPT